MLSVNNDGVKRPEAAQQPLVATLFVASVTLMAGAVLAIVVLHILAN